MRALCATCAQKEAFGTKQQQRDIFKTTTGRSSPQQTVIRVTTLLSILIPPQKKKKKPVVGDLYAAETFPGMNEAQLRRVNAASPTGCWCSGAGWGASEGPAGSLRDAASAGMTDSSGSVLLLLLLCLLTV